MRYTLRAMPNFQRGVKLTVDGEVIDDNVSIIPASQEIVSAYVYSPEPTYAIEGDPTSGVLEGPGPRLVGRIRITQEDGPILKGVDLLRDDHPQETWKIERGRGCVGCN